MPHIFLSSNYKSFEEHISAFKLSANLVSDLLRDILQSIEGGHVPPRSHVEQFTSSLEALQEKYQIIHASAAKLLGQDDIPPSGCSITEMYTAVNYQRSQTEKLLCEAEHILTKFLSVKSLYPPHMEELHPLCEKAQDLREQIHGGHISAEQIQGAITPYRFFFAAMTMDASDSEEKEKLFNTIDSLFPTPVSRALYSGKYYLGSAMSQTFADDNVDAWGLEDCPMIASTPTPPEVLDPADPALKEQKVSAAAEHSKKISALLPTPVCSPATEEDDEGELLDEENYGPILDVRSNLSGEGLKYFINGIFKNEYIHLFQIFASFRILTQEQVLKFANLRGKFGKNVQTSPTSCLQLLISKGCIKKLQKPASFLIMPDSHVAVALSVAQKRNIDLFALFQSNKSCGNQVRESVIRRSVAQNECMIRYLKGIRENDQDSFKRILDSVVIYSTKQKVAVLWKGEEQLCQLALDIRDLHGKPRAWLLVPEEGSPLPILSSLPEGMLCYAFQQGRVLLWEDAWKEENGSMPQVCYASSSTLADTKIFPTEEEADENSVQSNPPAEDSPPESMEEDLLTIDLKDEPKTARPIIKNTVDILPPTTVSSENSAGIEERQSTLLEEEAIPSDETIAETAARLANHISTPLDVELKNLISFLLESCPLAGGEEILNAHLAQALMLAKAAKLQGLPDCSILYKQLLLATGCPLDTANPVGYNLNASFSNGDQVQSLTLAAYIHALFAPFDERDYALQQQAEMYLCNYDQYFPAYLTLKPLFTKLCAIHGSEPCGFTTAVLAQLESDEEKRRSMRALQERAQKCMGEPNIKARLHGIPELCSNCFGKKSDMYACMEIISQNKQQDKDSVVVFLQEHCECSSDTYNLAEKSIENAIDSAWNVASKNQSTKRLTLGLMARKQIREAYIERLDVMKAWLESASLMDSERVDRLRKVKNSILHELSSLPESYVDCTAVPYAGVVLYMLGYIRRRLESRGSSQLLFADALRTGFIALDDRFLPLLDEEMCNVRYYEPWRRVLKHIALPDMTLAQAEADISESRDSHMFDNLHQLELIGRMQGRDNNARGAMDKARNSAKESTDDFMDKLELAYAAGRITEKDKEDVLHLVTTYEDDFFAAEDFGCWKQFLNAMKQQKNEKIESNRSALLKEIDMRCAQGGSSPILDKVKKHLADGQFAVAEECINIFDRSDKEHSEELKAVMDEEDSFAHFLSPERFDTLYDYGMRILKGRALSKGGPDFLKNQFPVGWTTRHKEDSTRFIQSWPSGKHGTTTQEIQTLMEALGVNVSATQKTANRSIDVFSLKVNPTPCNYTDYPHPIDIFGTKLKSPLMVVALYGSHQPKELVDTINALKLNSNGITIVLLDYALSRPSRCQLAEYCHQSSGLTPFIVIDRVLALHLALHQRTERMSVLLKCSLPYATAVQPFVRDGGPTSDEMFYGRTRELTDILDLKGVNLVYGGRQLGKTALLQRAQSRFHAPASKCFAVFCSIKDKFNEKELVEFLVNEVNKETKLGLTPCNTLKAFCDQIYTQFHNGRVQAMLLLLDEADDFLRAVSSSDYAPVQALVDLKRQQSDFKFVLAGLNNVYRARNATRHNGVFGQLGQPLCIKPLSPVVALQLILRPLRYLGFKPGQDAQLETILSSTNYYPGILQFFGYTLAQSLNEKYTRYYRASEGTPPFILKSDLLGSIMNSAELNNSIKDKFRLSLELDDRYFMLARCIGMLYHYQVAMRDSYKGYTVQQIRNLAEKEYKIFCLEGLDNDEYEALLDEMAEMGILHRSAPGVYRLRKRSFLDIIGSDMDRLEAEIESENERRLAQ